MNTYVGRLAAVLLAGTILVVAAPARGQEWKIYTVGKVEPIDADFYQEEASWVFYKYANDPSMYVFAIGCNRVTQVARAGQAIPRPACPVEIVPENQSQVITSLLELEAKRLDESYERLRGITVQFNRAAADATVTLAGARTAGEQIPTASLGETLRVLNVQLNEVRSELQVSRDRAGAVAYAYGQHRDKERQAINPQRYFFAPR